MYEYSICNEADEVIFIKQCEALEKYIKNINKLELLEDVDGSKIQKYELNGKEIKVHNSNYLNEVYVTSQVKLEKYFS